MQGALAGGGGRGAEIRIVSGCLPEKMKSKVLTSFHEATGMLSTVPSLVSTLLLFYYFFSSQIMLTLFLPQGLCSYQSVDLILQILEIIHLPMSLRLVLQYHLIRKPSCSLSSLSAPLYPAFSVKPQASFIAASCTFPPMRHGTSSNAYFKSPLLSFLEWQWVLSALRLFPFS